MVATGQCLLKSAHAQPRTDDERLLSQPLRRHVGQSTTATKQWVDGWLHATYELPHADLNELLRHQRDKHGHFNKWGLLQADVTAPGVLVDEHGHTIVALAYHGLFAQHMRIGDVVDTEWASPHELRFKCRTHTYPLPPHVATAFLRFCDLLVISYPALLLPPDPEDVLQPTTPSLDTWRLTQDSDFGIKLIWAPTASYHEDLGRVTSTADAARLATSYLPVGTKFHPHPWLDAVVPIWTTSQQSVVGTIKRLLTAPTRAKGLGEQVARAEAAMRHDAAIAAALSSVSWLRVAKLTMCSSKLKLLLHRIKGRRLSGYDRINNRRGCPHCPTIGNNGGDVGHIF